MNAGEVSDAAVEAAAAALYDLEEAQAEPDWEAATEQTRDWYRQLARAAITAALPHLSPCPDAEDEIELLRTELATPSAAITQLQQAVERRTAQRDEARAVLASVAVLVERWRQEAMQGDRIAITLNDAQELQAALTTPAPTPVDDREALTVAEADALLAALESVDREGMYQYHNAIEPVVEKIIADRAAGYVKGGSRR